MKKATITIGIPAFNEEQNIESLLKEILKQQLSQFFIKEIIVYSDASTDKTDQLVTGMTKVSSRIKLIKGTSRKGKYFRMNELFAMCKTDLLIILDADIAMVGKTFINNLAKSLQNDKKALVVSAKNIFVKPKGFIPRILHRHFTIWDSILLSILTTDSPSQFSGTATAFKGDFARKLKIPANVQNPHLYLYLAARSKNGFRYCKEAKIKQYVPSSIYEVKTVLRRKIMHADKKLDMIFGEKTINDLQYIPRNAKIKAIRKSFSEDPFYTPLALGMKVYITHIGKNLKTNATQLWEINDTTKKRIAYEK